MSKATRNRLRPPPGWTLVCQWYAYAPDEFEERTGVSCAGDGQMFGSRGDAVDAAWIEHEQDLAQQAKDGAS